VTSKVMAWAACVTVFVVSPAVACQGKIVLLEENFTTVNPRWEMYNQIAIQDGSMQITANPRRTAPIFYKGQTFDKADICVDTIVPAVNDPKEQGLASLMFEGQAYDDYYSFYVSPANGTAAITRLLKGKWLYPIPFSKTGGIVAKGTNTLRLSLNGAHATAYVNGVKFTDFLINTHDGGGFAGLEVDGGNTAPVTWSFKKFKITNLP
jgi:hypothetical protein